jgi:hypothetical protein
MAYTHALNGYDRLVIYLVLVLVGLYLLSTMHHVRFFH